MDPSERGECIAHVSKSMSNPSPGPAFYHVTQTLEGACPPIFMKGRHSLPSSYTDVQLYNLPTTIGRVPRVSLHGRTDIKTKFQTPGPSYCPPSFGSGARKCSFPPVTFGIKPHGAEGKAGSVLGGIKDPSATPGPGPAAFLLRDKSFDANGQVGYTIKGCHALDLGPNEAPGPGAYAPRFNAVMKTAPKIAFHDRSPLKGAPETPGYRAFPSSLGEGSPKYTMKARATDEIKVI
jgi:hypothetical protein